MPSQNKKFWMGIRQALLMMVDVIEREIRHKPRTAELKQFWKDWKKS